MNSIVNTLLSVLLSWIRALINNVWTLLRSEDGGALFRFLQEHWLGIVIGICIACVLVDLVVYFFRWRPDYIWATHLRRIRRRREQRRARHASPAQPQQEPYEPPVYEAPPAADPYAAYAPPQSPVQPVFQQPAQELDEPVWDDPILWDSEEPADLDWQPEQPVYGAPQPEPADPMAYFRDMQAGYAPQLPPEQLYTPAPSYQPPLPETESVPVHPGLDEEAFRQNIGLQQESSFSQPAAPVPAFRPFTVTQEPRPETQASGALQRFAQKARDFIAMDDEQPASRELQSSVDVSKAFHKPVYPKAFDQFEE